MVDALRERERRDARKEARLFALLCNLRPAGKKTWKEEDFLAAAEPVPQQSEEAREALEAYRARVAIGRRKRKGG